MTSPEINSWVESIVDWRKRKGFETSWKNLPEKVMLVVTELGRTVDAHREGNSVLVKHELTDALIRLLDLMGSIEMNVNDWLRGIMIENEARPFKHNKRY